MRKLPIGSGVIKGVTGLLTTTRGTVLTVVVTSVIIAVAGFGFWYMRDAAPTIWLARSVPTATALPTSTPTLAPTATPLPTATSQPTATSRPVAKPVPTVVLDPQLSVNTWNIMETTCRGAFSPYGITLKNTGGGTVTWQATSPLPDAVQLNTWNGRLAAGQSQQVTMSWYSNTAGAGPIPPNGSFIVTFTSNGGDQQVRVNCPPS